MQKLRELRVVLEGPDGTDRNVCAIWVMLEEVAGLREKLQRAVDECPLIAGEGLKVRVEEVPCSSN